MDVVRQHLLAAARLSAQQYRSVQRRHIVGDRQNLLKGRTLGHDPLTLRFHLIRLRVEDLILFQQRAVPGLKVLDILQHCDHILNAAEAVKNRDAGDQTDTGRTTAFLVVLIILKSAYPPLLLTYQVKDTDVNDLIEIVDIHLQVVLPGNVPPVDHCPIGKDHLSIPIVDHDAGVNII